MNGDGRIQQCRQCKEVKRPTEFTNSHDPFLCRDCHGAHAAEGVGDMLAQEDATKALKTLMELANKKVQNAPHISEVMGPMIDMFHGPEAFASRLYRVIANAEEDGRTTPYTIFRMYESLLRIMVKTTELRGNQRASDEYEVDELQAQMVGILRQMGMSEDGRFADILKLNVVKEGDDDGVPAGSSAQAS